MPIGEVGIVSKKSLPESIFEIKAQDRLFKVLMCLSLDLQNDLLSSFKGSQAVARWFGYTNRDDRGAPFTKPCGIGIKVKYFNGVFKVQFL